MAGGNKVLQLIISGDASGAKKALKETASSSDAAGAGFSNFGKVAAAAFVAVGAAAVAFAKKSVDAYEELGLQTLTLERLTGGSATAMSGLIAAGEAVGVQYDSLTKGLGIFAKKLEATTDTQKQFGFASRDAAGNLLPMDQSLMNVADRFKSLPDGVQKTALALQLFGRGGKELLPLLNQGSEGIAKLEEKARSLGLIMSQDDVNAALKLKQSQRELGAAFKGVELQVGRDLVPALTSLAQKFLEAYKSARTLFDPSSGIMGSSSLLTKQAAQGYDAVAAAAERARKIQDDFQKSANNRTPILGFFDSASDEQASRAAAALARQREELTHMTDAMMIFGQESPVFQNSALLNKDSIIKWLAAQKDQGVTYDDATVALRAYMDAMAKGKGTTEATTAAIDVQDQALKDLSDQLKAMFDPLFGMIDAQKKLNDANWAAAVALKEHGRQSQEYKQAAEDAAKAALDFKIAQETLVEKVNTGAVSLDQARQQLNDWAAQGMITKDTANALWKQFEQVGYASQIKGSVEMDTSQAIQAISDFYKWTHANRVDVPLELKLKGARAAGGPVMANEPYLVGERGPEIFVPSTAGGIIPNGAAGGGAGSWGGASIYLTVHAGMGTDGVTVGKQIVDALAKWQQAGGRIPSSLVGA